MIGDAQQWLEPDKGESEEYITPEDVQKAFEQIYYDLAAHPDILAGATQGSVLTYSVPAKAVKDPTTPGATPAIDTATSPFSWQPAGSPGAQAIVDGSAGASPTAPTTALPGNLKPGDLFINNSNPAAQIVHIYDGTNWHQFGGKAGPPGATIHSGNVAPLAATGKDGDFYIDLTGPTLYGPKTGGTWPVTGTSLIGSPGQGIEVKVGDGTNGAKGTIYTAPVPSTPGGTAPPFTAVSGATPAGWTAGGTVGGPVGPPGPAPVFGTPTAAALAAGAPPTVAASGAGTTASPLVLTFGLPTGKTGDSVAVAVGDGTNGVKGQLYTAPVPVGSTAPVFTATGGSVPTGWTAAGGNITGPQGLQPVFGAPATPTQVAAGGTPTAAVTGTGTTAGPYILALGLVDGLPVHGYVGQTGDAKGHLFLATAATAPLTTGDVLGIGTGAAQGQSAALTGAGWKDGGDLTGPIGLTGHTPQLVGTGTTAPNTGTPPAGAVAGDYYRQTDVGGDPKVVHEWTLGADGKTWTQNTGWNLRGPMGPALSISGNIKPGDTAPTCAVGDAGNAWVLQSAAGDPPGTPIPVAAVGTWLNGITGAHTVVPTTDSGHHVGDLIFCDGTALHNGGQVEGPQGPPGPPNTITSHLTDATSQSTDPAITGTGTRPAKLGDLIITVTPPAIPGQAAPVPVKTNLGSVIGPMPQVVMGVGQAGPPAIGQSNHLYYQTYPKGGTAPVFPTSATTHAVLTGLVAGGGGWTDAGNIPIAPSVQVTVKTVAGNTPTTAAPTGTVQKGDVYLNTADKKTWIYDGTNWNLAAPDLPKVYTDATTGNTPATPAVTGAGGVLNGVTPKDLDVFINTVDHLAWIYDGTNSKWEPVGSAGATVTTSATTGETGPAPGTTTIPKPKEGDRFVNSADKLTWIYAGGAWVKVGTPTVTTDAVAGNTPATAPTAGKSGDVFINPTDGKTWIYDGTVWQPIGSGPKFHFAADPAAAQALQTAGTASTGDAIFVQSPFSIYEVK